MRETLREELREGFEEHLEKTVASVQEPVQEPVQESLLRLPCVQDEIIDELALLVNLISENHFILGTAVGLYCPSISNYMLKSFLVVPSLILLKNRHWFTTEDSGKWPALLALVTLIGISNAYTLYSLSTLL